MARRRLLAILLALAVGAVVWPLPGIGLFDSPTALAQGGQNAATAPATGPNVEWR